MKQEKRFVNPVAEEVIKAYIELSKYVDQFRQFYGVLKEKEYDKHFGVDR